MAATAAEPGAKGRHFRLRLSATRYICAVVSDSSIVSWNDRIGRTADQVLQAFDVAISNAKRRHMHGRKLPA